MSYLFSQLFVMAKFRTCENEQQKTDHITKPTKPYNPNKWYLNKIRTKEKKRRQKDLKEAEYMIWDVKFDRDWVITEWTIHFELNDIPGFIDIEHKILNVDWVDYKIILWWSPLAKIKKISIIWDKIKITWWFLRKEWEWIMSKDNFKQELINIHKTRKKSYEFADWKIKLEKVSDNFGNSD